MALDSLAIAARYFSLVTTLAKNKRHSGHRRGRAGVEALRVRSVIKSAGEVDAQVGGAQSGGMHQGSTTTVTNRTATRHRGMMTPPVSARVKKKLNVSSITLLEAWFAVRGVRFVDVASATGLARGSIYNLIECPENARASTLDAIASAMAKSGEEAITAAQVVALACARVRNPDRVSEEIREVMAAGLRAG